MRSCVGMREGVFLPRDHEVEKSTERRRFETLPQELSLRVSLGFLQENWAANSRKKVFRSRDNLNLSSLTFAVSSRVLVKIHG